VIDSNGVPDTSITVNSVDTANFSYGGPELNEQPDAIVVTSDGDLLRFVPRGRLAWWIGALIAMVSPAV
jgi:hypothetical protein